MAATLSSPFSSGTLISLKGCLDAVSYTHLDVYKRQDVIINGGNIKVKAGTGASGIGGTGDMRYPSEGIKGGNITINGGIVDASTGSYLASALDSGVGIGTKMCIRDRALGDISLNSECGVFGKYSGTTDEFEKAEVAMRQEVKKGDAEILSFVSGEAKRYTCKIEKISMNDQKQQNLTIKTVSYTHLHFLGKDRRPFPA